MTIRMPAVTRAPVILVDHLVAEPAESKMTVVAEASREVAAVERAPHRDPGEPPIERGNRRVLTRVLSEPLAELTGAPPHLGISTERDGVGQPRRGEIPDRNRRRPSTGVGNRAPPEVLVAEEGDHDG